MEVENIKKAATFKSFLWQSYKNTELLFLVTALFNTFMRQTLTDDFWGLHKNMNRAFPLIKVFISRPVETGGLQPPRFLLIVKRERVAEKYKSLQISRKLLVTLLWPTLCNP